MNELLEELKAVLAKHNAHIMAEAREEYEDGEWVASLYVVNSVESHKCPMGELMPDKNIIQQRPLILHHGEILTLMGGHVARFVTYKDGERIVIQIPIPWDKYLDYNLLDTLRRLMYTPKLQSGVTPDSFTATPAASPAG
jgi:hypothetical protein